MKRSVSSIYIPEDMKQFLSRKQSNANSNNVDTSEVEDHELSLSRTKSVHDYRSSMS